ncbi:MAG: hypothetical protein KME06_09390 [Kastovskya adunca ATA6-11-RM4]|nr:hypothetical protein [Kastovskya adunca ATA6-11-RM4]
MDSEIKKYADIAPNTRKIRGFYSSEINFSIPSTAIEISEEQWQDCVSNQGKWMGSEDLKDLVLAPTIPPPEPIAIADYAAFRFMIVTHSAYERVMDSLASVSPTRNNTVSQAWGKAEDGESLAIAVALWNKFIPSIAQLTSAEIEKWQAIADENNIPIKINPDTSITVVKE